MLYPTIKQYIDALGFAEDNFDQLASFRLVTEADGIPVMSSGNFAVVFKMQDTRDGSFHALKCFLKDQPGRAEAYHLITEELEQVTSSYLAHIRFLERELFVDTGNGGGEYPVLVMEWVEGITLDRYLRQHLSDPYALGMLAYHFARLGAWLLTQPFAHGDLKPDNILVRPDGTLVLVDYDGMFVPAMQGQKALETGTPDFRHPLRTDADFNEHIDDFPLASILLSLRAVAHCPDYLDRYGATDRLLLSEADYRSPEQSSFLRDEFPTPDAELNRIYALFLLALSERTLSRVSFRLFNVQKPIATPQMLEVNTVPATKEEISEGEVDEHGVVYSRDGKQLLKCQHELFVSDYHVRNGCQVIRGEAFEGCGFPTAFTLPDNLTYIGDSAFRGCYGLTSITLPDSLTHIGDSAFSDCYSLTSITLPDSLTYIGNKAFYGCSRLYAITLPDCLKHIGEGAFSVTKIRNVISHSPYFTFNDGCLIDKRNHVLLAFLSDQKQVVLPDCLTHIGELAFCGCRNITNIIPSDKLKHIGNSAFGGCDNLTAITLPTSLKHIGDGVFGGCDKLTSITLPASLTHIGKDAFSNTKIRNVISHSPYFIFTDGCLIDKQKHKLLAFLSDQKQVVLPDGLTYIEDNVFSGCYNLTAITLPSSLTHIGNGAFSGTEIRNVISHSPYFTFSDGCLIDKQNHKLLAFLSDQQQYVLPESLEHIGNFAFKDCNKLTNITLPTNLTYIGNGAFYRCYNLTTIKFPASLTQIGDKAFYKCDILTTISLPDGLTHIGEGAFMLCDRLTDITLSASLTHIGNFAFSGCDKLSSITLPASLTHIGKDVFYNCYDLYRIIIPNGMRAHFKALLEPKYHSRIIEIEEDLPF